MLAVMFIIDWKFVKDKPSEAGFENFDTGDATSKDADKDKPLDLGYLMKRILSNPVILTIIAAEFCTGFVRQGLMLWFVPFLKETHGIEHGSLLFSIATIGITVGGRLGGILCGFLSDRVFSARRPPVAFIFYVAQVIAFLLLGWVSKPLFAALLIPFCCMWIFGVHGMLSATSSMDFGGTKATATVTGFCDGVQYLGAGLTGFVLGGLLDKFGWSAWVYMIIPFSIIGGILMLRIWSETPDKARERQAMREAKTLATIVPAMETN
jgi:OPA family glycerol-3-phosphate transporter-like MFS transporter